MKNPFAQKMKLRPTLWRTCRALMNPLRLNMLRVILERDGDMCVRDFAQMFKKPDAIACIYLRQLNARGLIGVKRDQIKVFYNANTDRSLPDARAIQQAMAEYFSCNPQDGWESEIMTIFRAFSHFNRLAILTRLAEGPAMLDELFEAMGVCVKSIYHHFGFLAAAGLIRKECHRGKPVRVWLVRPTHPLAATLLKLTLEGAADGAVYYNEGTGRGKDEATKHVLHRIYYHEGETRGDWESCAAMKPRKGRLDKEKISALTEDEK